MRTPVRTFRLNPVLWEDVRAFAADRGTTYTGALEELVRLGLGRITLPATTLPKAILAEAEAKAAHLAAPKRKRRPWSLKAVHLGPIDPPLGSRLKGGTTPGKAKR